MIDMDQFKKRVAALFGSQKGMASAKKWKSGKRAGTIRRPAATMQFTSNQLGKWLWDRVGFNAVPCPYCGVPIDILSLTIDHVVPRSAGGEFSLGNMQIMCPDCNARKGNLTQKGFVDLLTFARSALSGYDQDVLLKRLKEANSGSANRFFRDKGKPDKKPAKQEAIYFAELPEF